MARKRLGVKLKDRKEQERINKDTRERERPSLESGEEIVGGDM